MAAPGFAAAVMIDDLDVAPSELQPAIVIDLACGKRLGTAGARGRGVEGVAMIPSGARG